MASFRNLTKSHHNRVLTFEVHDIDVCIVNALRRILWNDIENVALFFEVNDVKHSDINVLVNTSPTHNEFVAQRISLIPLHFNAKEIESFEKMRYKFVINKQNTTYDTIGVTTDDIQIIDMESGEQVDKSFRDRVFPRNKITKNPIVITKLKPNLDNPQNGNTLVVEAFATKGTKEKHTCYCPISGASYFNSIDKKAADEAFKTFDGTRVAFDSMEAQRNFYKNKYGEPTRFQFEIETECALTPEYLMTKAFDVLISKLTNLQDGLGQRNDDVVKVHIPSNDETDADLINVSIFKETHTLGNVMQCLLYNTHIRGGQSQLKYVGYNCPHPLQQTCILRLSFKEVMDDKDVRDFLGSSIQGMITDITKYKSEWLKTTTPS